MNLASSPLLRRLPVAAGALLAGLLAASPAQAASERAERLRADRPGAERALRQAADARRGGGAATAASSRPALAALSGRAGRARPRPTARPPSELLARPTDSTPGQPGGPYTVALDRRRGRTTSASTGSRRRADAPPGADGDPTRIPAYIEDVADVFETVVRARARRPAAGASRSATARSAAAPTTAGGPHRRLPQGPRQARPLRLRGARPRPEHASTRTRSWSWTTTTREYGYDGPDRPAEGHRRARVQPRPPVRLRRPPGQVDVRVHRDLDGGEGLPGGRRLPPVRRPVGAADDDADHALRPPARRQGLRLGGLQPLARRRLRRDDRPPRVGAVDQPGLVRAAAPTTRRSARTTAPASPTSWRTSPPRRRSGRRRRRRPRGRGVPRRQARRRHAARPTARCVSGKLDHTGYALFDVAKTNAPKLQLTGALPAGTAGAIMLVGAQGRRGLEDDRAASIPTGGTATVTLDDPGRYERITRGRGQRQLRARPAGTARTGTGPATSSRSASPPRR